MDIPSSANLDYGRSARQIGRVGYILTGANLHLIGSGQTFGAIRRCVSLAW